MSLVYAPGSCFIVALAGAPARVEHGCSGGGARERSYKRALCRRATNAKRDVCWGLSVRARTRPPPTTTTKHAPAAVIPVIFSAGGGLRACDDELLPCPEDRNGTGCVWS